MNKQKKNISNNHKSLKKGSGIRLRNKLRTSDSNNQNGRLDPIRDTFWEPGIFYEENSLLHSSYNIRYLK